MVTQGEDSLLEGSEVDGLGIDRSMDNLKARLKSKAAPNAPNASVKEEVHNEATGSGEDIVLEPEPGDEMNILPEPSAVDVEVASGGNGGIEERPVSKELIIPKEKGISIRKQIEQRILAGATKEELVEEGYNPGSIATIASELRAKEKIPKRRGGGAPFTSPEGMPIFAKGSPPEALISSVRIPDVANGHGFSFEQGMKFGLSVAVLGIRMAQELSGIGIQQAKPLMDMARVMREGETMAAKSAAGEAAMEAAGMVQDNLAPILTNLQRSGGGGVGTDPMKAMMTNTMWPVFNKLMGNLLVMLGQGAQVPQLPEGNKSTNSGIAGWSRRSE